jgi:hypothetical protein
MAPKRRGLVLKAVDSAALEFGYEVVDDPLQAVGKYVEIEVESVGSALAEPLLDAFPTCSGLPTMVR